MYGRAFIYSAWKEPERRRARDQIGLRIWRTGKAAGRRINHVMVCFLRFFCDTGGCCDDGKPCRGDHSQLATVQCLNPNGKKKTQDFSHKTYVQEQNSQFRHQEASSCDVLFSHCSRNRTERCQKKAIVLEHVRTVGGFCFGGLPCNRAGGKKRKKNTYFDSHLASKHSE